jgi:hypothetical protein
VKKLGAERKIDRERRKDKAMCIKQFPKGNQIKDTDVLCRMLIVIWILGCKGED